MAGGGPGVRAGAAKGAHLLPHEVTGSLEAALTGTLEAARLRRALAAAASAPAGELERTDQGLAARLGPALTR